MAKKRIWSISLQGFAVFLLVLIGLIPTEQVSFGQIITPTTGPTVPVSNWTDPIAFERNGWFPDITTDPSGQIHVAWSNSVIYSARGSNTREGYDVVLYTSSTDGVNWSPINEVAALRQTMAGSVEVTRPALLVDPAGLLHMTYRDIHIYYSQVPVQVASNAQYWARPQEVTVSSLGYFSRLAQDSQGRLHVIFTEDVATSECLICYHLFYRRSDDGGKTWSEELDISVLPTGAAKPQILVDNADNVHVVWEVGRGGTLGQLTDPTTIMYTVSYNRGETWSQPIEMAAPNAERSKNVSIGRDGYGNLLVTWWSLPEDVPYYEVSMDNGLSWSEPQRIPNVWGIWANYNSRLDTYSMATDSAGNIHLVMVGRLAQVDPALRVIHLVWDGAAWSLPEAIVSYNGDAPEWPRISISNGNQLNVVWFVRGEDFIWQAAADYYKVWYSRSQLNAPALQPTPWPTYIPPTVTSAPTEVVESTATPMSDLPKLEGTVTVQQMDTAVYSEVDQLMVVGRAAVPAVIVLVFLLIIILIIRRR